MPDDHTIASMMAESDLVALLFELRGSGVPDDGLADAVSFLATRFMLGECAFLASAVARRLGREHYVAFLHPDGRVAHAVVAASPQADGPLAGFGVDILGRRPLRQIAVEVAKLSGAFRTEVGGIVAPEEFDDGQERAMAELAEQLPWMRRLLRLPRIRPDGEGLISAARALGMDDVVAAARPSPP